MGTKKMKIGIPKEIMENEGRVAATPETVRMLIDAGHSVLIEKGAGAGSHIQDEEFQYAGAALTDTLDIWEGSDIVMKVKEPLYNSKIGRHELDMLPKGGTLVGFLHPANHPDYVLKMAASNITSFSMDCIPRVDGSLPMDPLHSMSFVAGYKAALMAADHLEKMIPFSETPVADLPGASALVVGLGTVGVQALKTLRGLGCQIKVVDIRPEIAHRARDLGAEYIPIAESGSASPSLQSIRNTISGVLPEVDIVILSALVFGERAPVLLTTEMMKQMRPGSVIADVSVDQGGNCEAVVPGEIASVGGIKIIGILNLPGRLPVHSTVLYARNTANFMIHLLKEGRIDLEDPIAAGALITHAGRIVHEGSRKAVDDYNQKSAA